VAQMQLAADSEPPLRYFDIRMIDYILYIDQDESPEQTSRNADWPSLPAPKSQTSGGGSPVRLHGNRQRVPVFASKAFGRGEYK
jgi:hypothetical protein